MHKPADTQFEIHDLLKNRWSPSIFSDQAVEPEKLFSLFEAARWSPSVGNSQPWSFIVVKRGEEAHQKLVETMTGRNPRWAHRAAALVLTIARLNAERPEMNKFAYYDVGQSVAHLTIQAGALGLYIHQMGGFDRIKARELFEIPEGYELMSLVAIGYPGNPDDLDDDLRERELSPRTRKPAAEFAFADHWNQPLMLDDSVLAAGD